MARVQRRRLGDPEVPLCCDVCDLEWTGREGCVELRHPGDHSATYICEVCFAVVAEVLGIMRKRARQIDKAVVKWWPPPID